MISLTSKNNEKIKEILKLKQKKYRDESGNFLVESNKVILEAIKNGYKIKNIICTKNSYSKNINLVKNYENVLILISENLVNLLKSSVTSTEIFAVIEKQNKTFDDGNFVILDNIQNPDNLGAIFRVCAATNFKNVFLLNCADCFNEKTVRSSMGNLFKLNLIETNINFLKEFTKNKLIYSANMNGENLFNIKKSKSCVGVIFGNEGNGVSVEVEKLANKIISIPMKNNVESLNVSVSSGIILYHLANF